MARNRRKKKSVFDRSVAEKKHALDTMNKKELEYEIEKFQDKPWKNEEEKAIATPLLHLDDPDHKKPVTRREFLGQNLMSGMTFLAAPSIFSLLANSASAQEACPALAASIMATAVMYDCRGGLGMAGGNFFVGKDDPTNFLDGNNYTRYGIPSGTDVTDRAKIIDEDLVQGLVFYRPSTFYEGFKETCSTAAAAKASGTLISMASQDDSGANICNLSHVLKKAQLTGTIADAVGSAATTSGGRARALAPDSTFRPTPVASLEEVKNLNRISQLSETMTKDQVYKVMDTVQKLNQKQLNKFASLDVTEQLKTVIQCGSVRNRDIITADSTGLDIIGENKTMADELFPYIETAATSEDEAGNMDAVTGPAVYAALKGKIGSVTIEQSGCDYHGEERNETVPGKNRQIGRAIGAIIEMAHRLGKPVVVCMYTDGSCATASGATGDSANGTLVPYTSDYGENGAYVMFAYNPGGRIQVSNRQIGSYGNSGVDDKHIWSRSPQRCAEIALANILQLNGRLSEFSNIVPGSPIKDLLGEVIAFSGSFS